MKKILVVGFLLYFFLNPIIVRAETTAPLLAKNSKSAVLIEESTGKILFEKNKDEKQAIASMTKVMTMLIIMESLENGSIKLTDEVYISKNAAGMGGSQIFIQEGDYIKVEDLLKGIAIGSANDASVAMAEYIYGTEENFVNEMNKKALALGLKNTHFANSHGLDAKNHYSTAYEVALLSRELLKYEKILDYTSTYEEYLTRNNGAKFWLVNTNKLIRFYKGIDGLKTGYTEAAGHCLVATMKKNNMRVISVVMKSGSTENRSSDTVSLMEYAYSMYYSKNILKKDNVLGSLNITKGKTSKITYSLERDVDAILSKSDKFINYTYDIKLNKNIEAPINKSDVVGILTLYDKDKKVVQEFNILSNETVVKANFLWTVVNNLRGLTSGSFIK